MIDLEKHVIGKVEGAIKLWLEITTKYGIELEVVEENGVVKLKPKDPDAAANRQFGANGVPADNWYTKAKIEFNKRVKKL